MNNIPEQPIKKPVSQLVVHMYPLLPPPPSHYSHATLCSISKVPLRDDKSQQEGVESVMKMGRRDRNAPGCFQTLLFFVLFCFFPNV